MIVAIWVSMCVGAGLIALVAGVAALAVLALLGGLYDTDKRPSEQCEEAYTSWSWAKFLVTLFILSTMFSVFCGVYASMGAR